MKNTLRLVAFLVLTLTWAATASAQQAVLSNTTLSGAITATAQQLVLASASASAAATVGAPAVGQCLYMDFEGMQITAISGTRVTVIRGQMNTSAVAHATSVAVWSGGCGNFRAQDPPLRACVVAQAPVRPWINVLSGNFWLCTSSIWTGVNVRALTYNSVVPITAY